MIEHLKNIGIGLCLLYCICGIIAFCIGFGYLVVTYPFIFVPILVLCIAWSIGDFIS